VSAPDKSDPIGAQASEADYATTVDIYKMLVDVRFKLLGFVPAFAGVSAALIRGSSASAWETLGLGAFGLTATLGIIVYDLRNSQWHNRAIHRANRLERLSTYPSSYAGERAGGVFNERPPRGQPKLFGLIDIAHGQGTGLVYAASTGVWIFLIASSVVSIAFSASAHLSSALGLAAAAIWAVALLAELAYHDDSAGAEDIQRTRVDGEELSPDATRRAWWARLFRRSDT
jgi:hypothetical protein